MKSIDGERTPTTSVVLTFRKTDIPKEIRIQYLVFRPRPYVRDPVRCYNCQLYGHVAKYCFRSSKCSRCCGRHDTRNCPGPQVEIQACATCGSGSHTTGHKDCPSRIRAVNIEKTVAQKGITYAQAAKGCNHNLSNQNLGPSSETGDNTTRVQDRKKPKEIGQGSEGGEYQPNAVGQQEKVNEAVKETIREHANQLLDHQASIAKQLLSMFRELWKISAMIMRSSGVIKKIGQSREYNAICNSLTEKDVKLLNSIIAGLGDDTRKITRNRIKKEDNKAVKENNLDEDTEDDEDKDEVEDEEGKDKDEDEEDDEDEDEEVVGEEEEDDERIRRYTH